MAHNARISSRNVVAVQRQSDTRTVNVIAVIRHLLAHGPTPRSELALVLGLSPGAVTRITAQARDAGLLEDLPDLPRDGRGRPQTPIALAKTAGTIATIQIGVLEMNCHLISVDGTVLHEERLTHTPDRTPIETLTTLASRLLDVAAEKPLALTVICGGWIDSDAGIIRRFAPLDWNDVPVRDELSALLSLPVHVESTVRAHALSDIIYGTANGTQDFIHVYIGNILEIAQVVGGNVRTGRSGVGGDLSDWPVPTPDGILAARDVITDRAVTQLAIDQGVMQPESSYENLVDLASRGAPTADAATAVLAYRAAQTGRVVAQLVLALTPSLVIVSSGVTALEAATTALTLEYEAAFPEPIPVPPLWTYPQSQKPLPHSGAAVAILRTLLDPATLSERLTPARD